MANENMSISAAGLAAHHHFLTLNEYEQRAAKTDRFGSDKDSIDQLRYGLFGEVGSLLSAMKKSKRERFSQSETESANEELGDALWYLTALIRREKLTLEQVTEAAIVKLQKHLHITDSRRISNNSTFHEVDGLLAFQNKQLPQPKDVLLYQLAAQAGVMFSAFGEKSTDLACGTPLDLLAELLSDVAMVAATFSLKLSEIAQANLEKIESRWRPEGALYTALFDEDSSAYEQIPRELKIAFIERDRLGKKIVFQQWRGVNIGDPLTDNRLKGDGYRYHDVFHLAYMAHLGWSPVIRGLLKCKRKSQPDTDENEDGARAMIIEEGIATWIFNHARDGGRNYFEGVEINKLEYGLLKQVQNMVSGYEVAACPLWQWERAILDGFSVFRQLRDATCGVICVDMNKHTITFEALEQK